MMTNLTFAASRVLFISFSNLSSSGNYKISKKTLQYAENTPKRCQNKEKQLTQESMT